jgi:glutaredoxin
MFTVYSKDNCGFCVKAKSVLSERGIQFEVVDAVGNKDLLVEKVINSGAPMPRTVPQIFDNDKYVGGYTELIEYLNTSY